jgi:hypothetical protein
MVPSIDVDFDVYKALTNLRATEEVTYNDVIRGLLKLEPEPRAKPSGRGGAVFKGVSFPDGTQFRVTYKGKTYTAEIRDGKWIGSDGEYRNSPSEAAHAITGTSVNGWRFWHAKRPGDPSWRVLSDFR